MAEAEAVEGGSVAVCSEAAEAEAAEAVFSAAAAEGPAAEEEDSSAVEVSAAFLAAEGCSGGTGMAEDLMIEGTTNPREETSVEASAEGRVLEAAVVEF